MARAEAVVGVRSSMRRARVWEVQAAAEAAVAAPEAKVHLRVATQWES